MRPINTLEMLTFNITAVAAIIRDFVGVLSPIPARRRTPIASVAYTKHLTGR